MCLYSDRYSSKYRSEESKEAFASDAALSYDSLKLSDCETTRIPLPPPPEIALMTTEEFLFKDFKKP